MGVLVTFSSSFVNGGCRGPAPGIHEAPGASWVWTGRQSMFIHAVLVVKIPSQSLRGLSNMSRTPLAIHRRRTRESWSNRAASTGSAGSLMDVSLSSRPPWRRTWSAHDDRSDGGFPLLENCQHTDRIAAHFAKRTLYLYGIDISTLFGQKEEEK